MFLFKLNTKHIDINFFPFIIPQLNQFLYITILPDIPGQGWGGYPGTLDYKVIYISCKFSLYKLIKTSIIIDILFGNKNNRNLFLKIGNK